MRCQKCGAENVDGTAICSLCGCDMKNASSKETPQTPKVCKMAAASLALAILSIFTLFIPSLIAMALGAISLKKIKNSGGRLTGRRLAVAGIVISSFLILPCILLVAWCFDAEPIVNDYTVADFRSAAVEFDKSYELMKSLGSEKVDSKKASALGLGKQDIRILDEFNDAVTKQGQAEIREILMANGDAVEQIWAKTKEARDIVNRLSEFDEVADLTEPSMKIGTDFSNNLIKLSHVYAIYACHEQLEGNGEQGVEEWIKFDSVIRKFTVNVRDLCARISCYSCFHVHLRSANYILNQPETSQETAELLANYFVPLVDEQVTLRNSLIDEYLAVKNSWEEVVAHLEQDTLPLKNLLLLGKSPLLKWNSTLRLYSNYCTHWIARESGQGRKMLSVWPKFYAGVPEISLESDFQNGMLAGLPPWYYFLYNPMGSITISIIMPGLDTITNVRTRIRIEDDLFQIVLGLRMGRKVSLKARAYGDEYIIDVDKAIIYSPGPDEQAFTKDDIKLPLNPEVLGIGN